MILTFDIGNTDTVLGIFDHDELVADWRLSTRPERTADEFGLLLRSILRESDLDPADINGAAVASVVPPLTHALVQACMRHVGTDALVLDAASTDLPVRLEVEEPLTVGADRIVNTLAASTLYGRDTIAVDLGTATTFDVITGEGVFLGGVIAPGVSAGLEWLARRTAKLPRVALAPPERCIGRRTETCIQSGIFYTVIDGVDGMVARIRDEWDRPGAHVVATGGFAGAVGPHCRSVERVEPFLTLYGLAVAGKHLGGQEA